jgi:hypothetical protein
VDVNARARNRRIESLSILKLAWDVRACFHTRPHGASVLNDYSKLAGLQMLGVPMTDC